MGAVLLQRHDVIRRCRPRLQGWQADTGGFWESWDRRDADGEQLLFPTAQAGMTLLSLGSIEAAVGAGEWLAALWSAQPDAEHRLFAATDGSGALITDVEALEEPQRVHYVTRNDQPFEHHFNGGIAAAFLGQLYEATGQDRWLELARAYQRFSMSTAECQFESMQTCKSGWGSGVLYAATHEAHYAEWTGRLGRWFVQHQHDDGHWENTPYWTPDPDDTGRFEITVEFVMHLAHITRHLSAGDPR
jgi:hypothetical protein